MQVVVESRLGVDVYQGFKAAASTLADFINWILALANQIRFEVHATKNLPLEQPMNRNLESSLRKPLSRTHRLLQGNPIFAKQYRSFDPP
jgi:hypothetical protein